VGPFVDETDGFTAEIALALVQSDVRLKKASADWTQKAEATAPAHEESGWYRCLLSAADTDTVGHLVVAVHKAGARPVRRELFVIPQSKYDELVWPVPVQAIETDAVNRVQPGATHIVEVAVATNPPTHGRVGAFRFDEAKISVGSTVTDLSALTMPKMVEQATFISGNASTGVTGAPVFVDGAGSDDTYEIPVSSSAAFVVGDYVRARSQPSDEGHVYEIVSIPDGTTLVVHSPEAGFDIEDGDTVEEVTPSGRYVGHLSLAVDTYLSISAQSGRLRLAATTVSSGDAPKFDSSVSIGWTRTLELDLSGLDFRTG
jgi:hypothetical protein